MTLPGFTAEASLEVAHGRYRAERATVVPATTATVLPQWCYVTESGNVCCWTPWFGWSCGHILRPFA